MNFYPQQHNQSCGSDLHAKARSVGILDQAGTIVVQKNLPPPPAALLRILAPYREEGVGGGECSFTWEWLADLCQKERIPVVLGHVQ